MKYIIAIVAAALLIGGGVYWYMNSSAESVVVNQDDRSSDDANMTAEDDSIADEGIGDASTDARKTVIGTSVEKRDIVAYHYGTGEKEILMVGGIHGGYEWNTSLVAYEAMDYLEANPEMVPEDVRVTIIPVLNPDGLASVVGTGDRFVAADVSVTLTESIPGRFNANKVDLNRNFECDWQAAGTWQSKTVSGGTEAFSEPESQALRNYVTAHPPTAVVAWYSAAGGVFASSCHNGVSAETLALTNAYAKASGYKAYESFNFYEITGDMVNWFAKQNVPAISVLLTNHTDIEWNKNKAGIDALLKYYSN